MTEEKVKMLEGDDKSNPDDRGEARDAGETARGAVAEAPEERDEKEDGEEVAKEVDGTAPPGACPSPDDTPRGGATASVGQASPRGGGRALLAICVAALAGWIVFHLSRDAATHNDVQERLAHLGQQLRTHQERGHSYTTPGRPSSNADNAHDEIAALGAKQQQLASRLQEILNRDVAARSGLGLAEVEHLIVLAAQQIEFGRDAAVALRLLQTAEQRLQEQGHGDLESVRRPLEEGIRRLRAVREVDIGNLALHLANMAGQVDNLAFKPAPHDKGAPQRLQEEEATIWGKLGERLRGMVTIQRREAVSLLSAAGQSHLRQLLKLELGSARLAVLLQDTAGLRESIRHLLAQLQQHFDPMAEQVVTLREALLRMQEVELQPELPELQPILLALRRDMYGDGGDGGGAPASGRREALP